MAFIIALTCFIIYMLIGLGISFLLIYLEPEFLKKDEFFSEILFDEEERAGVLLMVFLWPIVIVLTLINFICKGICILINYISDLGKERKKKK